MIELSVNGKLCKAEPGETILSLLKRERIYVPTLCDARDLLPSGSCRLCIVEIEGVEGFRPSCTTQVQEGMKITTFSPALNMARRTMIELLLASHPDGCLYCRKESICKLRKLAENYRIPLNRLKKTDTELDTDYGSNCIMFNHTKCIDCGNCVSICTKIQGLSIVHLDSGYKPQFNKEKAKTLQEAGCIECGQCVIACPTGAVSERCSPAYRAFSSGQKLPERVIWSPLLPFIMDAAFHQTGKSDPYGRFLAFLQQMGFRKFSDDGSIRDARIIFTARKLLEHVQKGEKLPLLAGCSETVYQYVRRCHPDFSENLAAVENDQIFCEKNLPDRNGENTVMLVSCIPHKSELQSAGKKYVLSIGDLLQMAKPRFINCSGLDPIETETPEYSTAANLCGLPGGFTEAVMRTFHFLLIGRELKDGIFDTLRNGPGIRFAAIRGKGRTFQFAAVSGLGEAGKLLAGIRKGLYPNLCFAEILSCPGGCLFGSPMVRQPDTAEEGRIRRFLYEYDLAGKIRFAHRNPRAEELAERLYGAEGAQKS